MHMREDILVTKQEKLEKLREVFGEAYPEKTARTHLIAEALSNFDALSTDGTVVTIVGRVRSLRMMGKIGFVHLEDGSGKMQVFLSEQVTGADKLKLFADTIEIVDFV